MRIKSIYVNNFKSLVDFKINLAKFNCLIGLNGSGKSTFLQFMDFLAQLMKGDIKNWLRRREWDTYDCVSKSTAKPIIQFQVEFVSDNNQYGCWSATYHCDLLYCVEEEVICNGKKLYVENFDENEIGSYQFRETKDSTVSDIAFQYEGSILSVLKEKRITDAFVAIKNFICDIMSCDLLAPNFLRKGSYLEKSDNIGMCGEDLAAFLWSFSDEKRDELSEKLKTVFPQIRHIVLIDDNPPHLPPKNNPRKELAFIEFHNRKSGNKADFIYANQINDGFLRLVAFLSQMETKSSILLFDEIENGINPELVDFLLKELVNAKQQIVVTTHSPLFLNYLEDDTARESVQYFYKTPEGYTQCIPFFEIPSIQEKLGVLGPGEAFADTDLFGLAREIEQITASPEKEK